MFDYVISILTCGSDDNGLSVWRPIRNTVWYKEYMDEKDINDYGCDYDYYYARNSKRLEY